MPLLPCSLNSCRAALRSRKLIPYFSLCLFFAHPHSAFPDSLSNVSVYANEAVGSVVQTPNGGIVNVGGVVSYNSNIAANGAPVGSSVNIYPGSGTTYMTPAALGLTSATVQVSSSTPVYGFYPGTVFSASALGTANLATGSVGVSAGSAQYCVGLTCTHTSGAAGAQIMDTLTFHIAGASNTTVTNIGVQFAIDGSSDPGVPSQPGVAGPHANMTGLMDLGTGGIEYNFDTTTGEPADGRILGDSGWASSTIVSQTPGSFIFDGTYSLVGSTVNIPVDVFLQCSAQGGSCSYADTAAISFDLPSNVSFTSDSGVFLTQQASAVPEPTFWPLLAGVLLIAMGITCNRRRLSRPDHSFLNSTTASR